VDARDAYAQCTRDCASVPVPNGGPGLCHSTPPFFLAAPRFAAAEQGRIMAAYHGSDEQG